MSRVEPLFAYLSILSVIQPARIQDIEASASGFLERDLVDWLLSKGLLRQAHDDARKNNLVVPVRRGVYFMTALGRQIVRREGFERSIDNRRLFLMKAQRKRYK